MSFDKQNPLPDKYYNKGLINNSVASMILHYLDYSLPHVVNFEVVAPLGISIVKSEKSFPTSRTIRLEYYALYKQESKLYKQLTGRIEGGTEFSELDGVDAETVIKIIKAKFPMHFIPTGYDYRYPKKDNRAKIVYSYAPGTLQQIIMLGYPGQSPWRDQVFSVLGECIAKKYPDKKAGLCLLVNELILLTDEGIIQHLAYTVTTPRHMKTAYKVIFDLPELRRLIAQYPRQHELPEDTLHALGFCSLH